MAAIMSTERRHTMLYLNNIIHECQLVTDNSIYGKIHKGTYKVRNEIETKRNETKRNQRKRNETKRNQRNGNGIKRNQRNRLI